MEICDKESITEELSRKYNETIADNKLECIRNKNHKLFYSIDINFLKNVDFKYKECAEKIFNEFNSINMRNILVYNEKDSNILNKQLLKIEKDIIELKKQIRSDLNTVIDYVDRVSDKIDVSNITKNSPLGILIINKYDAFKVYSANLDLSDLNGTMKRQSKRLVYLKELDYLINNYKHNYCKYNSTNTNILINNLYDIVGKYLFLLTDSEFEYTKEAIKKLLAYKFDFIKNYLPTYKIILTKIWNSSYTGKYYFICNLDLDRDSIYLMNKNNIGKYESSGYICDIPDNFIDYFNMKNAEIINYPLPCNLNDRYEIKKDNKVNLKAIYTTKEDAIFKSILPIKYINKNKNV